MDKNYSKLLPDGYVAYENQVAGHNLKDGRSPTGILKSADGYVLKPLTKHPQRKTEIGFYDSIQNNPKFSCFQNFAPEYKGTTTLKIKGLDITFLKLQDITRGYEKPCVMDVKIGARTWDPNASEAKRKTEDEKYSLSKKAFGFCIPGYQVFDLKSRTFIKMGKEEGKSLDTTSLPLAFQEFLNVHSRHSKDLIDEFLKVLDDILAMWLKQNEVHIYSSSLLLTYDANQLDLIESGKCSGIIGPWVNVKMIDFAHVVPANGSIDLNYISGLKNLIKVIQSIKGDQ